MLSKNRTTHLNARSVLCILIIVAVPMTFAFAGGEHKSTDVGNQPQAELDAPLAEPAILTGRVTNHADEPLVNALVRVAIPATNMLFIETQSGHKLLETKTDSNGEYRLELPGVTKPTTASMDAMKPGYRKLVGTLMKRGDVRNVKVKPGLTSEESFSLVPSVYAKGTVVDEDGEPISGVAISANLQFERSSGGIERTVSKSDGTFEIFNYSLPNFSDRKPWESKGVVGFSHPNYIGGRIEDIYSLKLEQLKTLRIVMFAGRRIAGTVLGVDGEPVPDLAVKVNRRDRGDRKGVLTDDKGRFVLSGIEDGVIVLRVHNLERQQKAKQSLELIADIDDLPIQLKDISLSNVPVAIDVLGLQLADITPELQSVYDSPYKQGALIFSPGDDYQRFKIGELVEGHTFFMVGEKHIGSVREFIEQLIAEADKQDTDEYAVRVVYGFSRLDFDGTNTQYMNLTKEDVEQLRQTLAQLNG